MVLKMKQIDLQQPIDLDSLIYIHRWNDGFIGFCRKTQNGFSNIGSFPVKEIRNYFPQFRIYLFVDSYFTINSLYRSAPYTVKGTGFPGVWRKEQHLKYLNAVYCDLDVGRFNSKDKIKKKNWRYAVYKASELMDAGIIPQASIVVKSGRGAYLIWLLHQNNNETQPERAFLNKIQLYKQVNKELTKRLKHIAADRRAVDASRVLRVPGSYHGGTSEQVKYIIQLDEFGQGFTYSLDELAERFGIKTNGHELPKDWRSLPEFGRKTIKKGSCPNRSRGLKILNQKRIEDILAIEQYRNGFDHGFRNTILTLYCEFLNGAGYTEIEIKTALEAMAKRCNPPYPTPGEANDTPIEKIIEIFKPHRHTNKKLCRLLGITPGIALELGLNTIIPPEMKKRKEKSKNEIKMDIRLQALRQLVESYGINYGCRKFAKALQEVGIKCNRTTINNELKLIAYEMGIKRLKQGRPCRNGELNEIPICETIITQMEAEAA